jgi:uncharacterized protein
MNRLSALLVLALSFPLAAHADEASRRAKAQEMMALLHTQQMVENIAASLKKQLPDAATSVIGANPTPEKKNDAAEFIKHADQAIDTELSWSVLQPAFTDIYVKNFTEEQLDGIIAFYKSPAGLAMLTIMPTVNTQVQQYGDQKIVELKPQIRKLYEAFNAADGAAPAPLGISGAPSAAPSTPQPPSLSAPK